jgi:seryl-tRNA synthetase|tara:strand:- start:2086 stop:3342 length:1257 start_codon:yes stop_codon:yes gene_type:complete
MLDIKFIRENSELVKKSCAAKQVDCDIDKLLELDERRRQYLREIEDLRSRQKKLGKEQMEEGKKIKKTMKGLAPTFEEIEKEYMELMYQIPNIPKEEVPEGKDEEDNVVLRQWGKIPKFDFKAKNHLELGEDLDIIDVKRASKVSGTRFSYLKGEAALLQFALVDLIFNAAVKQDFIPIIPPVMIREDITKKLGYWEGEGKEDYYVVTDPNNEEEKEDHEEFYLVGTAEHAIAPMHKDEVLDEKDLPRRYIGFSTAFRREAGSYGKDTKGILRVHQFDKIELFSICHPDKSEEEHKFLLAFEEKLWQALKIPHQVVQLSTGDMSNPSATTIDIEAWMPGQDKYREVSSASNTTDFQSRRLNIRFKKKDGKLDFVHMLNATGFPVGRTIIAILENNQQKDGSVKIPKVLQKYIGKKDIK